MTNYEKCWYSESLVNKVITPNLTSWRSRYDLKEQLLLKDNTTLVIRNIRATDIIPVYSDLDIEHKVTPAENYRPDMVAESAYGDPRLAWVILAANNLDDIFDFVTDLEIIIPAATSLYKSGGLLNR